MQINTLLKERVAEIKEVAAGMTLETSASDITMDLLYLKKLTQTSLAILKKKENAQSKLTYEKRG